MIENERQSRQVEGKCQRLSKNMKIALFEVYRRCILTLHIPPVFAIVVIGLSAINLITYLLNEDANVISSIKTAEYIKMFPQIFNIAHYFKQSLTLIKTLSIISTSYLCVSFLLLIVLLFTKRNIKFLTISFYIFSIILYWILVLPFIDLSLLILTAPSKYPSVFIALSTLNIFLTLLLCCLHSLFGHTSLFSLKKPNGFSRVDCHFELFYLIIRLLLIITYTVIVSSTLSKWILISIHIVLSLVILIFNCGKLLFYDTNVCAFLLQCELTHFYCSLVAVVTNATDYGEFYSLFIIGVVGFYFASRGIVSKRIQSLISSNQFGEMITSPYVVDKYMKSLCSLVSSTEINESMVVSGISDFYDKECGGGKADDEIEPNSAGINKENKGFYALFANGAFYIPHKKDFMTRENFHKKEKFYDLCFILVLYTFYLKNVKSTTILISYLNFQYELIGNFIDLLFNLYNARGSFKSVSIQEQFSMYMIKSKTISQCEIVYNFAFSEIEKSKLKIGEVIEYYSLVSLLKRKMVESANASYSFWNNFVFNSDNKNIYQNGIALFNMNLELETLFKRIRMIYNRDDYLAMKFAEYIRVVKGDEKLATKYANSSERNFIVEHIDEIREAEKLNNLKEFFFSSDSVVIIVNFTKERNVIDKCTESVFSVFGYNAHQMLGKEIENLMPPFFKEHHSTFISYHFLTGRKYVIGQTFSIFGYNSKRFCFELNLMVMMLPAMDSGRISYMGVMQKIDSDSGVMLVLPNGKIDSISEKLSRILKLSPEDIVENDIYIYHLVMGLLTREKGGKNYILDDTSKFTLNPSELTKMKWCTDPNVVMNFRKAMSTAENNRKNYIGGNISIVNSIREVIKMYMNSIESASWPILETEIIEQRYHNHIEGEEGIIIYEIKVFFDEENDVSTLKTKQNMGDVDTIGNINNFNSLATINSGENDNENENSKMINKNNEGKVIIKNLNLSSSLSSSKNRMKAILMEENAMKDPNKSKQKNEDIKRYKRYEALSSVTSNMSSAVYANYANFVKKLNKHLTESPRSLFASIIGLILLIIEVVSSIVIFIFEYKRLKEIKEAFKNISFDFNYYDSLNCAMKLFNDDIINKVIFNKLRNDSSIAIFNKCIDNIISDQNFMNKISRNEFVNKIKEHFFVSNIYISSESNSVINIDEETEFDMDLRGIPSLQFMMMLVDYMMKLNSSDPFYSINDLDLKFVRNNFEEIIINIYETSTKSNSTFIDSIHDIKTFNILYLSLRLSVIFISFLIILPILIIKKKEQIQILDNFFSIKTEDAETQKEACRKFLEASTNLKLDDNGNNANNPSGVIDQNEKKTETNNININNKSIDKNEEQNEAFSAHQKNKDKNTNGSSHSKNNKKAPSPFSAKLFIIATVAAIIIIVLLISIIPIVSFVLQINIYNTSLIYVRDKFTIDEYAFYMEQSIIQTQAIIMKAMLNEFIDEDVLKNYSKAYYYMLGNEATFSDFASLSYHLSHYDQLYQFLQQDMCAVFESYSYTIENCNEIQDGNAQKGMKPIYSQITSILTDLTQTIQNSELKSWDKEKGKAIYDSNNYIYLSSIFDQFVVDGFDLILDLLVESYSDEIDTQLNILIVLLCLFGLVLGVNMIVVWSTISAKIHSMETDTYRLFAILPIGFIIENKSLIDFLNKITKEDR